MGDEHDEAVGRRVVDPDDVARAALAGDAEAVVADAEPGGAEAPLDARVRAALGGAARGARPGLRQSEREAVAGVRRPLRGRPRPRASATSAAITR